MCHDPFGLWAQTTAAAWPGPAVECWIQPRSSRSMSCARSSASSPSDRRFTGRDRGIGLVREVNSNQVVMLMCLFSPAVPAARADGRRGDRGIGLVRKVNSTQLEVVMLMCLFSPAVPAGRPFTPPQPGPGPESLSLSRSSASAGAGSQAQPEHFGTKWQPLFRRAPGRCRLATSSSFS